MNITIKTTHLLPAALLLMLASCSQQEEPVTGPDDSGSEQITFRASLSEVTSRAKEVRANDISDFHVTAFNPDDQTLINDGKLREFISDVRVEKKAGSELYNSDKCQWPKNRYENTTLSFFAYYPALNQGAALLNSSTAQTVGTPSYKYKINNFSIAPDIARQVDFITAYATGSMKQNGSDGIGLQFRHQLSRIEVKAKGTNSTCDIEIAGVRICNALMSGTFEFPTSPDADGAWTGTSPGTATCVFSKGEAVVTIGTNEKSIIGAANYAMLIPATYDPWDYENDRTNSDKKMYLSVLLRIVDKNEGKKQRYPYTDTNQGPGALGIPRVYLAVGSDGKVTSEQLYKGGDGKYYTDSGMKTPYTVPQGSTVREFGWSAIPITGDWKPGYYYTYTLDYTSGVGLHAPDVKPSEGPNAGDPIISDKVGLTVSVKGWQTPTGSSSTINVPAS